MPIKFVSSIILNSSCSPCSCLLSQEALSYILRPIIVTIFCQVSSILNFPCISIVFHNVILISENLSCGLHISFSLVLQRINRSLSITSRCFYPHTRHIEDVQASPAGSCNAPHHSGALSLPPVLARMPSPAQVGLGWGKRRPRM